MHVNLFFFVFVTLCSCYRDERQDSRMKWLNPRQLIQECSYFVEIKWQLDATDVFLLQILLLAQIVLDTIMPIIRSSRVLYSWLPPVVFGVWFSSCQYGVELRIVCPVCGLLLKAQPSAPHYTDNLKTKHQRPQAATNCIILSSSWWWA
jgi:hypothetical protein